MKKTMLMAAVAAALGLGSACENAYAAAFAGGGPDGTRTLVVVQAGDGSVALTSSAAAAFLKEFTLSGSALQSIALPTAAAGSNNALTLSGSASSEGFLTRSVNTNYLTLGGYNAAPGTSGVTSGVGNRVVGRISMDGTIDTTTLLGDATGLGNIRSTVSNDGGQFWVGTSSGAVRYTTFGSTGASTQLNTAAPTNMRVVNIYNGQLYVSSASGTFQGVGTDGPGLPTTSGQTPALLNGFPTASGPMAYDYVFADDNTLYVADDRNTGSGGIQKWTQSAGTWSLKYTLSVTATTGLRGLTGFADDAGNFILFGTTSESSANKLVTITDLISATVLPVSETFTTLATAQTNTAFRGVEMVPEPASAMLLALAPSFGLLRRSRRHT
jgi:hypothetical protein